MKNSKCKTGDFCFETIYDPYRKSSDDTFDEIYRRYLKDDTRIIEKNGLTYYKAVYISKLTIDNMDSLEVVLPWEINPNKDCIFVDEDGNKYEYRGYETMSFDREIPEWYLLFFLFRKVI